MPPLYRYTRGVGRTVVKTPTTDTKAKAGELIALPGQKHRTYRAPVMLDANNKPVRTRLVDIQRRKDEPEPEPAQQSLAWITVFGTVIPPAPKPKRRK